jgi:hypothetical protein
MLNLKTDTTSLKLNKQELSDKLWHTPNFESILPKEASNFRSSDEGICFTLKGMPEIRLKKNENSAEVLYESDGGKMPFSITCHIEEKEASGCEAYFSFSGDFNPMMAMMAKKPLQNFINTLLENLSRLEN